MMAEQINTHEHKRNFETSLHKWPDVVFHPVMGIRDITHCYGGRLTSPRVDSGDLDASRNFLTNRETGWLNMAESAVDPGYIANHLRGCIFWNGRMMQDERQNRSDRSHHRFQYKRFCRDLLVLDTCRLGMGALLPKSLRAKAYQHTSKELGASTEDPVVANNLRPMYGLNPIPARKL